MTMGRNRNRCVIKGATPQKVMPHDEFIDRIRKSLYFGGDTLADDMEVSRPLAEYASELFSEPHKGHSLHRLNRVTAGSIHTITPCSLIMALIYLDRLNVTDPGYVRRITPQELFIVSMMISTKFYAGHDEEIYISDWAEDGNMTEDRLKQLELEFLCAINWNIYISNEQFFIKLTNIEKTLARREGLRRGWLTYTELVQMLPSFTLVKFLFNNITVMAVSYAASVMTIAGAFFLASQIPLTSLHRMQQRNDGKIANDILASDGTDNTTTITASNNTHPTTTTAASIANATSVTIATANATCNAINVEAELLKLERQYHEEALLDELRKRNSEQENLPMDGYELMNQQHRRALAVDLHKNWLSLKEEYSDELLDFKALKQKNNNMVQNTYETTTYNWPTFTDCAANLGNCTSALFWHLLADATENSIVRLPPLLWFKFI